MVILIKFKKRLETSSSRRSSRLVLLFPIGMEASFCTMILTFQAEIVDVGDFVGRMEGFADIKGFGVAGTLDFDFLAVLLAGVSLGDDFFDLADETSMATWTLSRSVLFETRCRVLPFV